MRILLDECVPLQIRNALSDHDVNIPFWKSRD
jgi:hypothetical protein